MKIRISLLLALIGTLVLLIVGDWRIFAGCSVIAIVIGLGDMQPPRRRRRPLGW